MAELHVLHVTLSEPNGLDISDEELEIVGGVGAQIIVWQLDLPPGVTGMFLPKDAFAWVNSPKWDVFSTPRRTPDGLRLVMDDAHVGGTTSGRWIYLLRVGVPDANGKIYTTTIDAPRSSTDIRTTRNPVIINR